MNLLEVRFTVLWVPSLPGPPGVFYSQIVHTEPPAVFRLWLWFPLQAQAPMVVSPWEASTSSVHLWASPVLGVAVCLLWQMQKEISLSFFLIYTHLSYLIQYQGLFFIFLHFFFFFLFAPRFIEDWLLGFHVLAKFLIWVAFLTTQWKSGLVSHLQLLSLLVLHQFSLVIQSCPTLCDPVNRSTPGLPVHHQLPEFTQTHVHRVSDARIIKY